MAQSKPYVGIDYGCYGHWALAAQNAGFNPTAVWQPNVYDPSVELVAEAIHQANFNLETSIPDSRHEEWKDLDIIVGSPPCIGISGANPNAAPDHPANKNFVEFFKHVAIAKPEHFLVEICEPIFTRGEKILAKAMAIARKSGYSMSWKVFDVENYGSPSIRRRPYFFGTMDGKTTKEIFDGFEPTGRVGCKIVLEEIRRKWDNFEPDNRMLMSKYLVDGKTLRNGPFRTLTKNKRYLDAKLPSYTVTGFLVESVFHYSKTAVRTRDGKRERLLSVPEVARLMGFPLKFKLNPDDGQWQATRYSKVIASGVQIDFTTKLMSHVLKVIR